MSKRADVAFGRRGGHQVPDGYDPRKALADIERIRARELAKKAAGKPYQWHDGPWPPPSDVNLEGRARMARARQAAGVPLDDLDRRALELYPQ